MKPQVKTVVGTVVAIGLIVLVATVINNANKIEILEEELQDTSEIIEDIIEEVEELEQVK